MRFGYGGDSMYDKMIRLTKNNGRIDVTIPEIAYQGNDKSIYRNYYSRLVAPVAKSLKIIATGKESSLVDITDWMMDDDSLFSLKRGAGTLKLGGAQPQYTQIVSVKAFPENINFISNRSYMLN